MKRKSIYLLFFSFFLFLAPLFGQTYATGAILDPVRYQQVTAKPVLVSRNYSSLPRSVSLKQYTPLPENQGEYGTCTGWAISFSARTIAESIELKRTNQRQNSNNVFSPYFLYVGHFLSSGITPISKKDFWTEGAYIPLVLDFLIKEGTVKRPALEKTTPFPSIIFSSYNNLKRYPISSYTRLFPYAGRIPGTIEERVLPVKKSLSEGKPVVIGMNTPSKFEHSSFTNPKNVWNPHEDPNIDYGGHAMCVIGYDDNKHGGAFEVQNSWGTNWGNNGYMWIKYNDFARFVAEAYDIIENLALYKDATRYAASIAINVFNDNRGMPVTFDKQGFYKTQHSYRNGTLFQFQMTNKYPSYVYAFSADNKTSEIVRVFPEKGVSPVLDYTDSTVAWPDENTGMVLDGNADTHYLIVLYSKQALDINVIEQRFAKEKGTFPERVAKAVGPNFIPYKAVQYSNDKIEFSTVSTDPKSVFGLLLAINHQTR